MASSNKTPQLNWYKGYAINQLRATPDGKFLKSPTTKSDLTALLRHTADFIISFNSDVFV